MTRSEKIQLAINVSNMDCRQCATKSACRDCPVDTVRSILLAEQKRAAGCPVCRGETGIGGGMRIIDRTIECDSPDSYYRNSTSDEIHFCPNCGRDLTEGESV